MTVLSKIKSLLHFKKPEPWYKRWLKKSAFILDMKRRNKIITFIVLFGIALYICMPSMEGLVRRIVQQYGSELTGTNVDFAHLSLRLTSGEGRVRKIVIGNPKGYQSKNLFTLDKLAVKVNISSLTDDTIIIDNILVNQPVVTYEMLSPTQNNISDVISHIKAQTASISKESPEKTEKATEDGGKKVVIKELTVTNGKINVIAGIGTLKQPITLPLPTMTLKNIGEDNGGQSITDTLATVLQKVLDTAGATVIGSGLKALGTEASDVVDTATGTISDLKKSTTDSVKNLFN